VILNAHNQKAADKATVSLMVNADRLPFCCSSVLHHRGTGGPPFRPGFWRRVGIKDKST
jgi:hypothetical protein